MADEETGSEFDLESTLAAAKEAGVTLMTQEAFDKRFGKEAAKRDALSAQFDALKAQYDEDAAELQKFRDKGKSEAQREAEATLKLQKQAEAYKAQAAEEAAKKQRLQQELANERIGAQLGGMLSSKAQNLARATLIARTELPGLGLGDDGRLTITDPSTEIEYTGDDAAQRLGDWWEKQTDLHRSTAAGPPAGTPKPGGDHRRPHAELTDEERFQRRHGANV
jgi:hypothetical protein